MSYVPKLKTQILGTTVRYSVNRRVQRLKLMSKCRGGIFAAHGIFAAGDSTYYNIALISTKIS